MTLPLAVKQPLLVQFHERLRQPDWTFIGSGPAEKDRQLLVEFGVVAAEFLQLPRAMQDVIADITARMGAGMAEFAAKDQHDVVTTQHYELYCHYVAGLVGIGLSRLFAASGLEGAAVAGDEALANSMGLFLQKTNIIRDYLEDLQQGRTWWPRDTWAQYAAHLADLAQPSHRAAALACLNDMVTDALRHVPDVFAYMSRLRSQRVFSFCAIPQVMAIATLACCYNNPAVFAGVVKIRKGEAVTLMLRATTLPSLLDIFTRYVNDIAATVPAQDPSRERTRAQIAAIRKAAGAAAAASHLRGTHASGWSTSAVALAFAAGFVLRPHIAPHLPAALRSLMSV